MPYLQPLTHLEPHDFFLLQIKHDKTYTRIDMKVLSPTINTIDLPQTFMILKKELPSILRSKCFNDECLPFSREVRRTEIGHLFEHILLEYLCLQKISQGFASATYRGTTNWNWKQEAWGTFHIKINAGNKDELFFEDALSKSIELLKKIMYGVVIPPYFGDTAVLVI